jgi:hypothetical protein
MCRLCFCFLTCFLDCFLECFRPRRRDRFGVLTLGGGDGGEGEKRNGGGGAMRLGGGGRLGAPNACANPARGGVTFIFIGMGAAAAGPKGISAGPTASSAASPKFNMRRTDGTRPLWGPKGALWGPCDP